MLRNSEQIKSPNQLLHENFTRTIITTHQLNISGGPVIAFEPDALGDGQGRSVLIGTVHGAFQDCSNDIPGIFVQTDDLTILEFLQKEVYNKGVYFHLSKSTPGPESIQVLILMPVTKTF